LTTNVSRKGKPEAQHYKNRDDSHLSIFGLNKIFNTDIIRWASIASWKQDTWCITRSHYSKYTESALCNQGMSKPKRAFMPPLSALFPNMQVGSIALDFHWGIEIVDLERRRLIMNIRQELGHLDVGACMKADWQLMIVIDIHRIASVMYARLAVGTPLERRK
jgi:hypothetical protein